MSTKPGFLVVDAEATITNHRETQPFRWFLRIGRNTRPQTVDHEMAYDAQAIVVPHGATITPTLYEQIPLPPGRYIVMLQLQSYQDAKTADGKVLIPNLPLASKVFFETVE
ncbi:MAG: hypothetical protein AB7I30_16310 [Isosphaeraceae bacterium]